MRTCIWKAVIILSPLPRQLPPCTSKAPFIRLPAVHNYFDFRVLRENRRVVKDADGTTDRQEELENFHRVLMNISEGKATQRVRDFIVNAYVRGAISCGGCIENVGLEGSTAVFTKRRFRVKGLVVFSRSISPPFHYNIML